MKRRDLPKPVSGSTAGAMLPASAVSCVVNSGLVQNDG